MIGPTTRVFGLVTAEDSEAWIARLFNTLFGFNGLDAAYLTFTVRAAAIEPVLSGIATRKTAERVHVAPSCWEVAAKWSGSGLPAVDTLVVGENVQASFEHPREVAGFLAAQGSPSVALAGDERLMGVFRAQLEGTLHSPAEVLVHVPHPVSPQAIEVTTPRRAVLTATSWAFTAPRSLAYPEAVSNWPTPQLWIDRARREIAAAFGVTVALPDDLGVALREPKLRPCKLTDDAF